MAVNRALYQPIIVQQQGLTQWRHSDNTSADDLRNEETSGRTLWLYRLRIGHMCYSEHG